MKLLVEVQEKIEDVDEYATEEKEHEIRRWRKGEG